MWLWVSKFCTGNSGSLQCEQLFHSTMWSNHENHKICILLVCDISCFVYDDVRDSLVQTFTNPHSHTITITKITSPSRVNSVYHLHLARRDEAQNGIDWTMCECVCVRRRETEKWRIDPKMFMALRNYFYHLLRLIWYFAFVDFADCTTITMHYYCTYKWLRYFKPERSFASSSFLSIHWINLQSHRFDWTQIYSTTTVGINLFWSKVLWKCNAHTINSTSCSDVVANDVYACACAHPIWIFWRFSSDSKLSLLCFWRWFGRTKF